VKENQETFNVEQNINDLDPGTSITADVDNSDEGML